MPTSVSFPIQPKDVRYVKLGAGGAWEKECIEKGIIRFGFGSGREEMLGLCRARKWTQVTEGFLSEGRDPGTATRFTNEVRFFFEDPGSTLWITFVGERLYWGLLTPDRPEPHEDGKHVVRRVAGGWRSTDRHGEELTKDRLSGALTKLAAYKGTSCWVGEKDYVVRRINGEKAPKVERAIAAQEAMKASIRELMTLLQPKDFEILVDLVFTQTGWRRLGTVGKTHKTLDLDIVLPTTGERALVQVKSETSSAEAAEYAVRFKEHGPFDRMFYVFHTGDVRVDDDRVTLLGPKELPDLVLEAGLVGWLLRKVP